jgi:tetratricopeptide (TPR) repeat protein
MAAAFKLVQAWALVKQGTTSATVQQAIKLLDEADSVIRHTDDNVCLADIQSAQARIARRRGLYSQSLKLYNRAVEHYARADPQHRRLAHALLYRAPVKQYLACILDVTAASLAERDRALLRNEAAEDLRTAEEIYALVRSVRGRSMVLIYRSQLDLDLGRLHQADDGAEEAYQIAKRSADRMVMGRARIQQCRVAHAWAAGDVDRPRDRNQDLDSAFCFADEAVDLAQETQNAKLIAQSYIWRGLTLVRKRPARLDEAEADCRKAARKLDPAINDYVRDEITTLQSELATLGHVWRSARARRRDRAAVQAR